MGISQSEAINSSRGSIIHVTYNCHNHQFANSCKSQVRPRVKGFYLPSMTSNRLQDSYSNRAIWIIFYLKSTAVLVYIYYYQFVKWILKSFWRITTKTLSSFHHSKTVILNTIIKDQTIKTVVQWFISLHGIKLWVAYVLTFSAKKVPTHLWRTSWTTPPPPLPITFMVSRSSSWKSITLLSEDCPDDHFKKQKKNWWLL